MADAPRHPMRRAVPTIAISAAALSWMLNARYVADDRAVEIASKRARVDGGQAAAAALTTTVATTIPPPPRTTATTTTTTTTEATTSTIPLNFKAVPTTVEALRSSMGTLIPDATPGLVMPTSYGPIQVAVVVTGGKVTEIQTVMYPDQDDTSREINEQALPRLRDAAVRFQSARVDAVSGATVTSAGFKQSLQSAMELTGTGSGLR